MHNFFLNIFLFLSLFFASETINISLDPISHNTFYLDSVHPVYQPDLIGEYIIDGDIGSARSVFLLKDLYPKGQPYSWTVIGELEDLQAATVEDVKEFYNEFYGPSNTTIVIAGDIDFTEYPLL